MHPIAPDQWFNDKIALGGGIFDRKSFDMTISTCTQFNIAFDIGAHVGSWSIGMAKKFKEVYSFEPEENNYRYLQSNIKEYQNIHAHNLALGNIEKMVDMCLDGDNSGMSHIACKGDSVISNRVQMTTLDDFLLTNKHISKIGRIDLIKIDVEGYEIEVLLGGANAIKVHRPVIMLEISHGERYGYNDAAAKHAMTELGYKFFNSYNKDHVYIPYTI